MAIVYLPALFVSTALALMTPQGEPAEKPSVKRTADARKRPEKSKNRALEPWEIEVLKNLKLLEQMELLEKLDLLDDWQLFYEKGGR